MELIIPILFQKVYESCPDTYTWTQSHCSVRTVQLLHVFTGLIVFLYPYFFFFFLQEKSLVLKPEDRTAPILHTSFMLFKHIFFLLWLSMLIAH